MGREVVRAVHEAEGMEVVAAIDRQHAGEDCGVLAGIGTIGVEVRDDLAEAMRESAAEVVVDFTVPASAMGNIRIAIDEGIAPVVGTTGLTPSDLDQIREWAAERGVGTLVAPNFAIGAVLMMQFARQAARYLPDVEIIELHHENKVDSPSGTALMTAEMISAARTGSPHPPPAEPVERIPGARGTNLGSIPIHSVRLPGYVAHQEVIFGGLGQTLTIRHDSIDRRSFMPGVILSIRRVPSLDGLVVGLEHLLAES
jgi:4-hydroxy-tetrahydrodipicolinate reductase